MQTSMSLSLFICLFIAFSLTYSHHIIKPIHATLNTLTLGCIAVGLCAAILAIPSNRHFYTLHSWIGITTIFFFTVQYMSGVWMFAVPHKPPQRRAFIPSHAYFGTIVYISS